VSTAGTGAAAGRSDSDEVLVAAGDVGLVKLPF